MPKYILQIFTAVLLALHSAWGDAKTVDEALGTLPRGKESVNAFIQLLDSPLVSADETKYESFTEESYTLLSDPDSPLRNDTLAETLLRHVVQSKLSSAASKARARFRLELVRKNCPGSEAPDFEILLPDGSLSTLYKACTGKKTILIFYDPDCDHCVETISALKVWDIPVNTGVLAVDVAGDKERWKETCGSLPESWIKGFAEESPEDSELYDFPKMPVIYLLDSDKRVVLKEASLHQIQNL